MSKLLFTASKRILKHAETSSLPIPIPDTSHLTPPTVNVPHLIKTDLPFNAPQEDLIHDKKYYEPDSEGGFCIFRVENTLFKVIHPSHLSHFACSASLSRSIDVISCASHQRLEICLVFQLPKEAVREDQTTRQSPYLILSNSFVTYFGYYTPCTSYQRFELGLSHKESQTKSIIFHHRG
jgi:hypothetical protein